MALDDKTCVPVPCPPFEAIEPGPVAGWDVDESITAALDAATEPERHQHQTVGIPWRSLPEGAKARLAEMTRHPQCLITRAHAAHSLMKATTSGFRCGGDPKPPRA